MIDVGADRHPTCSPANSNEALGQQILSDLRDVIKWTDNNSSRSLQSSIGPSELGGSCDRKIAYRVAGVEERNWWSDPLPAIVGTAVHTWLERAVNNFQAVHYMERWLTEITVHPDPMVKGHLDLYDADYRAIIDWKTVSPTKLKEWKSAGPPEHYKCQVNLYGKGALAAGLAVDKVCLIAVPRSGGLKDMQVWLDDYRPELAQKALDRMYSIAGKLISMGDDMALAEIDATPGDECNFCPWYRGGAGVANLSGCPGNSAGAKAKYGKGLIKDA
jgi:hypothetical protein